MLHARPEEFYKKAISCARHYGFLQADEWGDVATRNPRLVRSAKERNPKSIVTTTHKKIDPTVRELEGAVRLLARQGIVPGDTPILLYVATPGAGNNKTYSFSLHAFGIKHSMAEALVLKTATAILNDIGVRGVCIHINSIGCRDSSAKFAREVSQYFRKSISEHVPAVRQALEEDVFLAYHTLANKHGDVPAEAPKPIECLTSISRKHLREVLEFLEAADVPYCFNDALIGHRDCFQHVLFDVRSEDPLFSDTPNTPSESYARGGRYDELARHMLKQTVHAVGVTFTFESNGGSASAFTIPTLYTSKKPRAYLIRIGYAAELKSFHLIESLRKAKVTLEHSVGLLRLSEHIEYAEKSSIPYTIIMGQKEALEGSVIIRHTTTRAQQTIPIKDVEVFFRNTC